MLTASLLAKMINHAHPQMIMSQFLQAVDGVSTNVAHGATKAVDDSTHSERGSHRSVTTGLMKTDRSTRGSSGMIARVRSTRRW